MRELETAVKVLVSSVYTAAVHSGQVRPDGNVYWRVYYPMSSIDWPSMEGLCVSLSIGGRRSRWNQEMRLP